MTALRDALDPIKARADRWRKIDAETEDIFNEAYIAATEEAAADVERMHDGYVKLLELIARQEQAGALVSPELLRRTITAALTQEKTDD